MPAWRLKSLEGLVHAHSETGRCRAAIWMREAFTLIAALQGAADPLPVLAAEQPSWSALLYFLSFADANATEELLTLSSAAPQWGKYWIDQVEAVSSAVSKFGT